MRSASARPRCSRPWRAGSRTGRSAASSGSASRRSSSISATSTASSESRAGPRPRGTPTAPAASRRSPSNRPSAQAMTETVEPMEARSHEPGLAEANERLLVRLGFDLHDGPLQQVYVLAQDIRLLREQVIALVGAEHREPVVGRFGDLEAEL